MSIAWRDLAKSPTGIATPWRPLVSRYGYPTDGGAVRVGAADACELRAVHHFGLQRLDGGRRARARACPTHNCTKRRATIAFSDSIGLPPAPAQADPGTWPGYGRGQLVCSWCRSTDAAAAVHSKGHTGFGSPHRAVRLYTFPNRGCDSLHVTRSGRPSLGGRTGGNSPTINLPLRGVSAWGGFALSVRKALSALRLPLSELAVRKCGPRRADGFSRPSSARNPRRRRPTRIRSVRVFARLCRIAGSLRIRSASPRNPVPVCEADS